MKWKVSILMFLLSVTFHVSAQQSPPLSEQDYYDRGDLVSKFEPSLAAVIGVLAIMFALTFILLIYAKCCHVDPTSDEQRRNRTGGFLNGLNYSRFSGIDKTVIESLPFFRFSALKGSKQGLECAVCLSKFEDIEILRLLPKCKHAFHIRCVDQWLEHHGTCPLCRTRVTADDLNSPCFSFRFSNGSGIREDSNLELFIEREEGERGRGSSRFGMGGSFRKILKRGLREKLPESSGNGNESSLHKLNHKILVSDVVFKNRWSNVSSSDLMFLNSEMTNSISRERFSFLEQKVSESSEAGEGILRIKKEMEMSSIKKIGNEQEIFSGNQDSRENLISVEPGRRSVSDITTIPRFNVLEIRKNRFDETCNDPSSSSSSSCQVSAKEERRRRLWLPIATRTAQWFANRENRYQRTQINISQHNLDV